MAIRVLDSRIIADGVNYQHLAGLSTDTKPTAGVCTGSEFVEADTGDKYLFDETSGDWTKVAAGWVDPDA